MKKNREKGSGSDVQTIKKVLEYIGKYKLLIAVSLILAIATVAMTLYVPILIGDAIDCVIGKGDVDMQKVITLVLRAAIIAGVTAILQWIMDSINNRIAFQVVRDIRNETFAKLGTLPFSYLDSHAHGDIISRVISDADRFSEGLLLGFTQFFTGIVTIVGTLIFMLSISPTVTLAVVLLTPLSLFVAAFLAKRTYSMFKLRSETEGEQTAYADEIIRNQKTVSAFSDGTEEKEVFAEINERQRKAAMKSTFFSSLTNPSTRFINGIVYAAVALLGALFVISPAGSMSVGALSCFLSYANKYTKPFNEISGVVTELQGALASAARIFEIRDLPSEPAENENAVTIEHARGDVRIDDVSFSYTPDTELIKHFNLYVTSGQRIAIVGPTGCGKTTLINLLMRFYDTNEGRILLDGTEIRDITRKSLRQSYGMVLQETWLMAGTIRENICFGRPDATDEEVLAAAKAAHSHSFIKRLPNGYDTYIGEDGGILSQGQKQLLCITRVMLCLPPMLILDEATSSIDTRTELKIGDAFAKMMRGRTTFIVAHRLSTIRDADKILVMRDGNVIEQGTHESLLAAGGFYTKLYNSQFEN